MNIGDYFGKVPRSTKIVGGILIGVILIFIIYVYQTHQQSMVNRALELQKQIEAAKAQQSPLVGKWISDSETTPKQELEIFSNNTFKLSIPDVGTFNGTWEPGKDGFEMKFGKETEWSKVSCIGRYQPEENNRFVMTFEGEDYTIFHKLEAAKTATQQSKENNIVADNQNDKK